MSQNPVYCRIVKINRRQAYRAFCMGAVYGKQKDGTMIPVRFGNYRAAADDLVSYTSRSNSHQFYLRTA